MHLRPVALLVAAALLWVPAATAQTETTLELTITATPESYTVQTGQFQRDADGNYVRDANGSLVPVEQFVTISVEARLPCAVPPSDGNAIRIVSSGPTWTRDEGGEKRTLLGLEVREFAVEWEQESPASDWTASVTFDNRIINEGTTAQTIEAEYTWAADFIGYNEACEPDYLELNPATHELILPATGSNSGTNTDGIDPDEGAQGTPAPGVALALLSVGLAALLRRRQP